MNFLENSITVEEYLQIRDSVGWQALSVSQAIKALDNCLYNVKAVDDDGNIIGMGRVVGDGAVICYIQDLIVHPDYQGQSIGSRIVDMLKDYVISIKEPDTRMMFCLMSAKGREAFYEKKGFISRPTESLGPGMIMYLN